MLTFTVHEPPIPQPTRVDRAEGLVFIKDGFAWLAAVRAAVAADAPSVVGAARLRGFGRGCSCAQKFGVLTENTTGLMMLGLNVLVGFERARCGAGHSTARAGACWGAVSGRTVEECERRFFDGWAALPAHPEAVGRSSRTASPPLAGARLLDGSAGLTR
jgi:hypothetical protein